MGLARAEPGESFSLCWSLIEMSSASLQPALKWYRRPDLNRHAFYGGGF